jgi:diaminopimelate epimerase
MKFYKLNGAGNDFIIINNLDGAIPAERFPAMAKTLCERHLSLGADGLMVVERSDVADFRMGFYNSDGSAGEMCGNGARCICRYGYEMGLSGETQTVETPSGIVTGVRIDARHYRIRLTDPTVIKPDYPITVDGKEYQCGYVELGNPGLPHAVIPMPGLRHIQPRDLFELGRKIRSHPAFPKGANANFYDFTGENQVFERTFERGVEDFTYACGTGTGSVALILTVKGLVSGHNVIADMAGGRLTVDVERDGDKVTGLYLTGPTNIVAAGEILDEELEWK